MLKQNILIHLFILNLFSDLNADVGEGKELFLNSKECLACHSYSDFTQKENKINNFKKLHQQVDKCAFENDAGWFDDEVMSVSEYLNHYFYKYKRAAK